MLRTYWRRSYCYVHTGAVRSVTYILAPFVGLRTYWRRSYCYVHTGAVRTVTYLLAPFVLLRTYWRRSYCYVHTGAVRTVTNINQLALSSAVLSRICALTFAHSLHCLASLSSGGPIFSSPSRCRIGCIFEIALCRVT